MVTYKKIMKGINVLGKRVNVIIDRPLGSYHPKYKNLYYPVNYGYVENVMGGDNEWQDVYILGINEPIERYTGKVIAIIHRFNDIENKWVVTPEEMTFTKEQIKKLVEFQEQYFEFEIIM
ncbi:inorganic pyrophosphatase [Thomasclavelia spiroformis]|nr:inorganic pyrophosphatase [Thomasclavelia spiroformis]